MRNAVLMTIALLSVAGAAAVAARGQSTQRPGEPTQSRVWIENRAPNDAVPVIVESIATPVTTHIDSTSTVQTVTARQVWEYRSVILDPQVGTGPELQQLGGQGWEAVGLVQTPGRGPAVLLKRPR